MRLQGFYIHKKFHYSLNPECIKINSTCDEVKQTQVQ